MKAYQQFLKSQTQQHETTKSTPLTLENAIPNILFEKIPQFIGKGTNFITGVFDSKPAASSKTSDNALRHALEDNSASSFLLGKDAEDKKGHILTEKSGLDSERASVRQSTFGNQFIGSKAKNNETRFHDRNAS